MSNPIAWPATKKRLSGIPPSSLPPPATALHSPPLPALQNPQDAALTLSPQPDSPELQLLLLLRHLPSLLLQLRYPARDRPMAHSFRAPYGLKAFMEAPFHRLFDRLVEKEGEEGYGGETELSGVWFRLADNFILHAIDERVVGLASPADVVRIEKARNKGKGGVLNVLRWDHRCEWWYSSRSSTPYPNTARCCGS